MYCKNLTSFINTLSKIVHLNIFLELGNFQCCMDLHNNFISNIRKEKDHFEVVDADKRIILKRLFCNITCYFLNKIQLT
jgi:hypothetical protein